MLGRAARRFSSPTRWCISGPTPQQLADIVVGAAAAAKLLGHEPRVALLSHSTFGDPPHDRDGADADAVRSSTSARSISSTTAK
jgi:phosphotransacetylase